MNRIEPVMPEIDFAVDPLADLDERMAYLKASGERVVPVHWKGEIGWLVLRYDDVIKLLPDEKKIPAAPEYIRNWDTQGPTLLKLSGQNHKINREIVSKPFSAGQIRAAIESMLVPIANRVIDDIGDRREIDLIETFSHRYPFLVIAQILGIPVDNEQEQELRELVSDVVQGAQGDIETRRQIALDARARLNAYL